MSTGAWLDLQDEGERALCKHGNANVLTRDAGTSRLAQGPSAQSCLVQIARWEGVVPPLTAFDPPAFATAHPGPVGKDLQAGRNAPEA